MTGVQTCALPILRNITFENVVVNGEKIKDLKGFITNEYIEGIKIK